MSSEGRGPAPRLGNGVEDDDSVGVQDDVDVLPTPPRSTDAVECRTRQVGVRWHVRAPALGALVVSACSAEAVPAVPEPVASLPPTLSMMVESDLGQYFASLRDEVTEDEVRVTMARLRAMPRVQSVLGAPEGRVNIEFSGQTTPHQRVAVVKQLAALVLVEEGI